MFSRKSWFNRYSILFKVTSDQATLSSLKSCQCMAAFKCHALIGLNVQSRVHRISLVIKTNLLVKGSGWTKQDKLSNYGNSIYFEKWRSFSITRWVNHMTLLYAGKDQIQLTDINVWMHRGCGTPESTEVSEKNPASKIQHKILKLCLAYSIKSISLKTLTCFRPAWVLFHSIVVQ